MNKKKIGYFHGVFFALTCIMLLMASPVFSNSISSVSVEPTFECAGVIVALNGTDDPGNVTLEVKGPADGAYKPAHPFLRYDNRHMASSIFDLKPATNYSIKVTLGGNITFANFTTRTEFEIPNAISIVSVTNMAQLNSAISAAVPGTHIVLTPGTYSGTISVNNRNGTASNPIVIKTDISASERVKPIDQRTGLALITITSGALDVNNSSYIVFDSLRFENMALPSSIIRIFSPSAYCVIQDCQFIVKSNLNVYQHIIYINGDGGVTKIGRHLIQNNYLCDSGKGTGYSIRQDDYSPCGTVIRRNIVIGPRDGISPIGSETDTDICTETYDDILSTWPNQSTDVYENTIYTTDDNIEIDGIGVNCRIFRNNLMGGDLARLGNNGRTSSNISISPVMPGPFYILRNIMTNTTDGAIKFNTGCLQYIRNVYFYHNTIYDLEPTRGSLLRVVYDGDSAPNSAKSKNIFFKNNIFRTNRQLIYRDTTDHVLTLNPNYFYTSKASGTLFQWDASTYYSSYDSWRSATGQETSGYWGDPQVDPVTFHLNLGSSAIDKGVIITGINDGFVGSAPDMGAFEYGTGNTTLTTAAGSDVFANLKVYPNPFRLGLNTSIKIIGLPVDTTLKIHGVDGGLIRYLNEADFGNYGWITWDGKNSEGNNVAFGVYVCVVEDGKGNKKTGKLAVLK